ncbi:sulfurtransferase complex subunit TusB [Magnetofaba australis]|uniref:Putative DsrH family protein n=1 Tax=Magnetofaba australis IT-1 TaxID=1434232 RepID=A0A1Y2K722_9PROT|nr:sulfurtransferase complex subunit TusB [Magnetofaba australis]OSM05340.1 putative DsrH family protein [Magnetofaba australis IT-1]
MLHTVNKSPFQNGSLESCLRFSNEGDTILLLEDGVFAAKPNTSKSDMVSEALKSRKIYALSADLKARGVASVIDGVEITDYAGFVDLVAENATHAWL